MTAYAYMSNQEFLEAHTTAYRTFESPANDPVILDAVPFERFTRDVTSDLDAPQDRAQDGVRSRSDSIEHIWQELDKRMPKHRGTTERGNPVLRKTIVTLENYSKAATQKYDDRHTINVDRLTGEQVAAYQAAVPYNKQFTAWDRFLVGETNEFGLAYDGQNFFDTDHPGPGTTVYSNYEAGVLDLDETSLESVLQTMRSYRKENGDSWGNKITSAVDTNMERDRINRNNDSTPQFHIFTGLALQDKARDLLRVSQENPGKFAGMGTTSRAFAIDESDQPNSWYVWLPTMGISPLFIASWDTWIADSIDVDSKEMSFFVHARWGFGYSHWHTMFKVKNG